MKQQVTKRVHIVEGIDWKASIIAGGRRRAIRSRELVTPVMEAPSTAKDVLCVSRPPCQNSAMTKLPPPDAEAAQYARDALAFLNGHYIDGGAGPMADQALIDALSERPEETTEQAMTTLMLGMNTVAIYLIGLLQRDADKTPSEVLSELGIIFASAE
jgi:hypothetical protein